MFGKRLKQPSRGGERHLAAVAVKQPCAHFLLERANLRGDRRLRHAQLFCRAGKALELAHVLKRSQLFKIHGARPVVRTSRRPFLRCSFPRKKQIESQPEKTFVLSEITGRSRLAMAQ